MLERWAAALHKLPEANLTEGVSIDDYSTWRAVHCVGSVLAVKGSLRRFAPWTAAGRSERRAAYGGKRGAGRGAGGAVARA